MPTEWEAVELPSGAYTVNLTMGDGGNITADKTFSEIKAASDEGKVVNAKFDDLIVPLCSLIDSEAVFALTNANSFKVLTASLVCTSDNVWSMSQNGFDAHTLGISGASVGQIVKIKTVDSSGVPTEWEPADMPSGSGGSTDTSLGLTGAIVGQVPTVKSVDGNGVPTEWEAVTDSTPFIVEFNGGGITEWPYTSSHTFEQITVAISAGRYVIGHAEELMVSGDPSGGRYNIYFDLVSTMDVAIFQFVDASNHYQINVAIPNVENASVNVFGSYLSASSSTYGGVKADSAEGTDTQPVRIGTDGKLYTAPGSSGGSTDTSLGLTGASVGQTVKIKAVDKNGIPTEWEAADAASGEDWEFINEISTNEWISSVTINQDSNGNPFSLKKMRIFMTLPKTTNEAGEEQSNSGYAHYKVNDRSPAWQNPSNGWNNALFLWTIEAMGDYYTVTCFKDGAYGAQLWHSDVFKSEGAFRTITKFEWRMANGTMGWSSTNFKVYGVRA